MRGEIGHRIGEIAQPRQLSHRCRATLSATAANGDPRRLAGIGLDGQPVHARTAGERQGRAINQAAPNANAVAATTPLSPAAITIPTGRIRFAP